MVGEQERHDSEKHYMRHTPPVKFSGGDSEDGLFEDRLDLSRVEMTGDNE